MSGMKGKLSNLALMALMMGSAGNIGNSLTPKEIDVTPREPVIPKGCKQYWFNINGYFSTDEMLRSEIVFKCIASNDKNAINKFKKYQLCNTQ